MVLTRRGCSVDLPVNNDVSIIESAKPCFGFSDMQSAGCVVHLSGEQFGGRIGRDCRIT
jgi:hypothetical protein